MEDIFSLKVALWGDVVILTEDFGVLFADDIFYIVRFPDEEFALHPFTIGILGGIKTAVFCVIHLAENIVKRLNRYIAIKRLLSGLERLKIGDDELSVVVKHLLEMWDKPMCVRGISVETATELVIHTARAPSSPA